MQKFPDKTKDRLQVDAGRRRGRNQRSKSPLRAWQGPLVAEVRGETRRDDMETLRGAVVRLESMLTSHEAVATHADAPPPAPPELRLDVPPELRLVHEALQSHRAARVAEPPSPSTAIGGLDDNSRSTSDTARGGLMEALFGSRGAAGHDALG